MFAATLLGKRPDGIWTILPPISSAFPSTRYRSSIVARCVVTVAMWSSSRLPRSLPIITRYGGNATFIRRPQPRRQILRKPHFRFSHPSFSLPEAPSAGLGCSTYADVRGSDVFRFPRRSANVHGNHCQHFRHSIARWGRYVLVFLGMLLLLARGAPIIVAWSPLVGWACGQAKSRLGIAGSVSVGSVSLGWFSPIAIRNVEVRDEDDTRIVQIEKIESYRSLLYLLMTRQSRRHSR